MYIVYTTVHTCTCTCVDVHVYTNLQLLNADLDRHTNHVDAIDRDDMVSNVELTTASSTARLTEVGNNWSREG